MRDSYVVEVNMRSRDRRGYLVPERAALGVVVGKLKPIDAKHPQRAIKLVRRTGDRRDDDLMSGTSGTMIKEKMAVLAISLPDLSQQRIYLHH